MSKHKKNKNSKKDPLKAKKDMVTIVIIGVGVVIGILLGIVLATAAQQKSGSKQLSVTIETDKARKIVKLSTKQSVLKDILSENNFAVFNESGEAEKIDEYEAETGEKWVFYQDEKDITENLGGVIIKDGDKIQAKLEKAE